MIFGQDRNELRRTYIDAWRKSTAGEPMSALEAQIADVVALHPEYHEFLADENVERDFTVEGGQSNPFLHMGLHLALRDQLATNRPAGIAALFRRLESKAGTRHAAEHLAIDCLAETLWEAQGRNAMPDEAAYMARLRRLAG